MTSNKVFVAALVLVLSLIGTSQIEIPQELSWIRYVFLLITGLVILLAFFLTGSEVVQKNVESYKEWKMNRKKKDGGGFNS